MMAARSRSENVSQEAICAVVRPQPVQARPAASKTHTPMQGETGALPGAAAKAGWGIFESLISPENMSKHKRSDFFDEIPASFSVRLLLPRRRRSGRRPRRFTGPLPCGRPASSPPPAPPGRSRPFAQSQPRRDSRGKEALDSGERPRPHPFSCQGKSSARAAAGSSRSFARGPASVQPGEFEPFWPPCETA